MNTIAYITALTAARELSDRDHVVYALAWYGCRLAGIPTSELQTAAREAHIEWGAR